MRHPLTVSIRVRHPRRLRGWLIRAERFAVGRPGDYKPNLGLLPDGELLMVAFHKTGTQGGPDYQDVITFWRSGDGGRTWSEREDRPDVIGREPFLTLAPDGVLFLTASMLPADRAFDRSVNSPYGVLHRSVDGGGTWTTKRVLIQGDLRQGAPESPHHWTQCVRNVVALPDGTLLLGVSISGRAPGHRTTVNAYMWASHDGGVTWDENRPVTLRGYFENHWGFLPEGFIHRNEVGTLLFWSRLGSASPMYSMDDPRSAPATSGRQVDTLDRMVWYESVDDGLTWTPRGDFGDYAQMYPRVMKLRDGRLLMTYTQRALLDPIGLRARLSDDDGETWDLDRDQIMIEGFTPWGELSGGGFGNTVQLADGTLVSCYSFNPGNVTDPNMNAAQIHVVRWRLEDALTELSYSNIGS